MRKLKKEYEIVAVGNVQLQMIKGLRTKRNPKERDAIEEIWMNTQKEKGGRLFNGTFPNFVSVYKKKATIEIKCRFLEYKQFLAQIKRPSLKLGIKSIGVSGIIILEDKDKEYVLFAKRSGDVTVYPGFLELVPSGSIDKKYVQKKGTVDYSSQLLSEFVEETGISKKYVKEISGFAFVLDIRHHVYDICCRILLKTKRESVLRDFSSKEYGGQEFVLMDDLGSFINKNRDSIVPTSMALIVAYQQYFK